MVEMKARLYDKTIKPRATIRFDEDYKRIELQFSKDSDLNKKFKSVVKDFLEKNKLKIVSPEGSSRTHKSHKYNKKMEGFDSFFKFRNPRTQKIELKPIAQTPNKLKENLKKVEEILRWKPKRIF